MIMNISLTPDLEELVQQKVKSGRYPSANEVVRAALQLLEQKEATIKQDKFHQALLNSGLVKKINRLSYSQLTERQLIQVQGKPVSETIIEERR
jgi:putative addiction module CopG family antidote